MRHMTPHTPIMRPRPPASQHAAIKTNHRTPHHPRPQTRITRSAGTDDHPLALLSQRKAQHPRAADTRHPPPPSARVSLRTSTPRNKKAPRLCGALCLFAFYAGFLCAGNWPYSLAVLRSIHVVFSCTSIRPTIISTVASSPASSAARKAG